VTGEHEVVLEVQTHLDACTARCIALGPTRGVPRGAPVADTGGMLQIPVGRALLGRVLNVFGEVIDGGPARFVQSGTELSGLMGRIPSRIGYQPTLATELEERIRSSAHLRG